LLLIFPLIIRAPLWLSPSIFKETTEKRKEQKSYFTKMAHVQKLTFFRERWRSKSKEEWKKKYESLKE
jgi:hypothetical protein